MAEKKSLGDKLENIPMLIYYSVLLLGMIFIAIRPVGFPITVSQLTKDSFKEVEKLESGDIILIDTAYGPGAELYHGAVFISVFKQCIQKEVKIVMMSSSVTGPMMMEGAFEKIKPELRGYEYGKDYVHLGYIAGYETGYAAIISDVSEAVTVDYKNNPISEMEIFNDLKAPTYEKIALVIAFTSEGAVSEGWVRQSSVRYRIPLILHVTEVMLPGTIMYYPINVQGIINGGIGAAEYEFYSAIPGQAIILSDMQSVANGLILFFLIIANIGFIMKKFKGER